MEAKKKKIDGLLSLLANESTADSRRLLRKYGMDDAKNHRDLELKLAELYKSASDKIQMDKEFCAIHPHKDFIVKYTESKKPETTVEAPNGAILTEESVKNLMKEYINAGGYSNCAGNPNCGCGKSNFGGNYNESFGQPVQTNNNTVTIALSVIGIVAVLGIIMHHKH
jgi:hypothetical protein